MLQGRYGNNNAWRAVWGKRQLPALWCSWFFFSLIIWSWKSELVGYECCRPIIRVVVMGAMQAWSFKRLWCVLGDRPGIIQACIWLSLVERWVKGMSAKLVPKLELCSLFQLNQCVNKPVHLMFPLIWTAYLSSFSSLWFEQNEPVGKMTVWNRLGLSLAVPRKPVPFLPPK